MGLDSITGCGGSFNIASAVFELLYAAVIESTALFLHIVVSAQIRK
jgi:hypothetical protein